MRHLAQSNNSTNLLLILVLLPWFMGEEDRKLSDKISDKLNALEKDKKYHLLRGRFMGSLRDSDS